MTDLLEFCEWCGCDAGDDTAIREYGRLEPHTVQHDGFDTTRHYHSDCWYMRQMREYQRRVK